MAERGVQWSDEEPRDVMAALRPEDLAPLLRHQDAEIRQRAMVLLGRVGIDAPASLLVDQQNGRLAIRPRDRRGDTRRAHLRAPKAPG